MPKTTLLLGAGIGFILGSRAGRGPYPVGPTCPWAR